MDAITGEAARVPVDAVPRIGLGLFGDDRLARLAAAGDERALAAIYRRHHQDIYRYCRAILHDADEAEDALQATMVKAVSALPGETRSIALKPWLFRVAHNEAISILRARRPTTELDAEQPALGPDIERQASDRDRLRQLVRDLDRLPDRQRGALVMRELSGLSFEEIGAALGLGPAAAKQAVYEARVSLQEMAAGRDMDCEAVRRAVSARDRRTLRGRRIRAHLHDCRGCTDFATAIDERRDDLATLAPPLALPAALAALHGALGGGGAGIATGSAAGAGSLSGGLGGAVGASATVKTAATVLAATAIAGGAAGVTGVVHLGGSGDHRAGDGMANAPAAAQARTRESHGAAVSSWREVAPGAPVRADRQSRSPRHSANPAPASQGQGHGHAGGPATAPGAQGGQPPADSAASPTSPGQAQSSPGEASSIASGGGSQSHGKPSVGPQSVAHDNPKAQLQSSSATHSQAAVGTNGAGKATAPGQADAASHTPNPNSNKAPADTDQYP